ncbi:hypothetical protein Verru16b_00878 [Lacunisphaera limnophila]|uniref:PepSY-associated TM helix n=1 Tax=Lacunisphaera limnophila TaxID=1838286 RepID=A0A1D8ASI5_9BACT|nr:PepSY domain-containing protein [Lacunisphaera limnophila]AOS43820.1 hypothetical protein Verru16b_00878 [Lacunisphaera limnophila]
MKRQLHLLHRWLGIGLCLFFAAWFCSGFFMMYVEYPQLTRPERLAAAAELDFSAARFTPRGATRALVAGDFAERGTPTRNVPLALPDPAAPVQPDGVRLAQILGRPAYVFTSGPAQPAVVFAHNGEKLGRATAEQAAAAARAFRPGTQPRFLGTIQSDQWAVSSALNAHRPLHHFAYDDPAGTEVYVSSSTAEVVRDSTRRERVLNYFGAVTHYLYPHVLRQYPDAWAWGVDIVAATGCVLALSGLWVGVLRARRRVPETRTIQQRLVRWHYVTGAVFGVVTLTWVFSGWMSMNPGQLNPPRAPTATETAVLAGTRFDAVAFTALPVLPAGTVEAALHHYDGQPLYRATRRDGTTTLVAARADAPLRPPTVAALLARAPELRPEARVVESKVLAEYDDYYYSRHPETGTRPLPVLRVRFADAEATWFHLDIATGQVLDRSTRTNRVFRWLYNGLHSFDWWWLWSRRPLWDVVVIAFCAGGLSLSVLGVVVGVRRLRAEFSRPQSSSSP